MIKNYFHYDCIYVYGAGSNGRRLANFLLKLNYPVKGFMDIYFKPGTIVEGIPVVDLLSIDYTHIAKQYPRCLVCVSVFNREADLLDIREFLCERHFTEFSFMLDFIAQFHKSFGSQFWLSSPEAYDYSHLELNQTEALFQDPVSLEVFHRTLRVRRSFSIDDLPEPYEISEQYFSQDIPLKPYRTFVDAGAYDGDLIPELLAHNPNLETYIAFEPDVENFKDLELTAKDLMPNQQKLLFQTGLSDKADKLRFSEGVGESSRIDPNGSATISVVAMDAVLSEVAVDYIKMDIEGAEYEALLGSKKTIQTHRPQLAICNYHHPAHLLSIPLLIDSWHLNYKFYLRQYGYCGFEQVLYAIPQ